MGEKRDMREIKFRAWDKKEKRFSYAHFHPIQLSWASPKWTEQVLIRELDGDVGGVAFRNLEGWQEFTGLLDKNGKEIYEGDIVLWPRYSYQAPEQLFYLGEVRMNGGHWDMHDDKNVATDNLDEWNIECEVIGNIYESPELLKEVGHE